MMGTLNAVQERQMMMMVAMQKLQNAAREGSTSGQTSPTSDYVPVKYNDLVPFDTFCKQLQHIGTWRDKMVST